MRSGAPSAARFPEEEAHLALVSRRLAEALEEAERGVERMDREYRDERRYMSQYRGEIDPHEMFQNELALKRIDRSGAFAVEVRERLARLKDSPYFARVDFREEGGGAAEPCYLGSSAFRHGGELLICDWRAPIAGLFYDCEVGPAGYDAPAGRVEGELTRKRQFRIRGGVLEYALESGAHIQDDVLQRELSRTSDEKMKSIISTIQKEQNRVIRNERAAVLIIQGAAGSGKTSIALHRIAYLLYRFKDRLSAGRVTILSPNRVFGDFISNVLPELGEAPVGGLGLADIAQVQLEGDVAFLPARDPLEEGDGAWAERARFKAAPDLVERLDRFLAQGGIFEAADCAVGEHTAPAEWIRARFEALGGLPIRVRLAQMAGELRARFGDAGEDLPTAGAIEKRLRAMLRCKSTLALYRAFYRSQGRPELFAPPARNTLEWEDVYPYLYLRGAFEGLKQSGVVRHLVVDEMQDYTPVQFAVLNRLFPCPKTILGDFAQRVDPNHTGTLEDLRRLYPGAEYVELNKSYRSTWEIMRFAQRIQPAARLEPMERHGAAPVVLACRDEEEVLERVGALIRAFEAGEHATLGILTKTGREARALHAAISGLCGAHLLTQDSRRFSGGVSVASIGMSKGLEFDEVILPGVSAAAYAGPRDRSLLYVACTRAMHRLTLLYSGDPSPLLPNV